MAGKKDSGTRYDREIGERAAHIRNVFDISQTEVAARLGVTRQTLANYESGRTPMRAGVVRLLCDVYGISPSWLLGMTNELFFKGKKNGRSIELREQSPNIQSPMCEEES